MKRRSISWLIVIVMIISNLQLTFAEEFNSYDLLTQVDPYSENTTSNFDEMDNGDEESQEDNYYAYDSEEDYSDSELENECDSDWEEEEEYYSDWDEEEEYYDFEAENYCYTGFFDVNNWNNESSNDCYSYCYEDECFDDNESCNDYHSYCYEEECWDSGFSDDCYSYYQKGDCWNDECVNTNYPGHEQFVYGCTTVNNEYNMKNTQEPNIVEYIPENETNNNSYSTNEAPQTGDDTNLALWITLMALCLIVILGSIYYKKRRMMRK